jgi:chemotaxis protein CheD
LLEASREGPRVTSGSARAHLPPAIAALARAASQVARPERTSETGAPLQVRFLYPGEVFAAAAPCAVSTILGTCVAVCLWDTHSFVGGMNHYLLPYPVAAKDASPRFGQIAIPRLIEKLLALGAVRARLQAKVFGGMSSRHSADSRAKDLGASNVSLAFELLSNERIPVVARDVGGPQGRKLVFHLDDGSAWMRLL